MTEKKSKMLGQLILAANSIGDTQDIPLRTLSALKTSDLLIFEEDRPARKTLKAAGIHREYLRLTEHAEKDTIESVKNALTQGQTVCCMSDQGMPNLEDPGQKLLNIAYQIGARVQIIPGPSSISAALAACPFSTRKYRYHGFLVRDKQDRIAEIKSLEKEKDAIVILDTPYRRKAILAEMAAVLGKKRKALLALDITGPDEEFLYLSLQKLADLDRAKLNFVLVVSPS